ncbi:dipeptidase [candidate division KSB1 bacterium]
MKRRDFFKAAAVIPGIMYFSGTPSLIHQSRRTPVIDGMGEIRLEYPMPLISEIIDSGMTAVMITIGTPTLHGEAAYDEVINELAAYEQHINLHRDYFIKATKIEDIDTALKSKKLALIYLFQNAVVIERDLKRLDLFYNFGVRSIQLTYNSQNLVGSGCMERVDTGISNFGVELIETMNEKGIVIDLSHAGMRTMADAIKYSRSPMVNSHSGCKSVYDHARSTTDENIKALADNGGVMGIFQINPNLGPKQRNTLDDYLDQIDYAVKVGGIDHVGIGSDREHQTIPDTDEERKRLEEEMARVSSRKIHWPFFVSELNHARRMETIHSGLQKRGYSSGDIDKILGGNFYRVYKEVIG